MGETVNLDTARWRAKRSPNDHKPVEALRAALHAIESGEVDPLHIVVCIAGGSEEGGVKTSYYQAGTYNHHGQLGLLAATSDLMDKRE